MFIFVHHHVRLHTVQSKHACNLGKGGAPLIYQVLLDFLSLNLHSVFSRPGKCVLLTAE